MELKIKLYEKEGKRCCYIEDGKENGQEYRDISLEWLGEMVTELFVCMETSLDKGTQRKTTENELPSLTQCTA